MLLLTGRYNQAKVFSDTIEASALDQVRHLLDQPFVAGSKIRIMPDAHAGAGCTIGTTMTITDKVVPNLVGVDIGCGMQTVRLGPSRLDFKALDIFIRRHIPSGFNIRKQPHALADRVRLDALRSKSQVNQERALLSIGTLGGGNHFIEVAVDEQERLYVVVHSGSRHLGKQVAELYQKKAARRLRGQVEAALAYCEGELFDDYLNDMAVVQAYADVNRTAMMDKLINHLDLPVEARWTTVHNYIDLNTMILRKGAISAQQGERVLIPLNMRDGSLICTGKGNPDWNFSAPHGAGRLMSRREARRKIKLSDFQKAMTGVYSTTIDRTTVDEAPFAYKPMEEIVQNIRDTVTIDHHIRPLYNFKAAD